MKEKFENFKKNIEGKVVELQYCVHGHGHENLNFQQTFN